MDRSRGDVCMRWLRRFGKKIVPKSVIYARKGWCPLCEHEVTFSASNYWFRDHLLCSDCGSIPRERSLFRVVKDYFPNYQDIYIHESSPGGRGASVKLHKECKNYSASQFFPNIPRGSINPKNGYRCEDLEKLTFPDNSFDLFITQDVLEHIFEPSRAFQEIARVLKPGGAHIFTVPLVNKARRSERWASRGDDGSIVYHHEPEYHGNPVDDKGSLVTMHWGYDIAGFITERAGTPTTIIMIENEDQGIYAEYIDILVSLKPKLGGEL